MKKRRVAAVTLGCKLNYAETAAILDSFVDDGWELSTVEKGADLIIVHTCAVTGQAEQKSRQQIRKMIRRYPESRIAVIGCYAQLAAEKLSSIDGIALILGTQDKFSCSLYANRCGHEGKEPFVKVSDVAHVRQVYSGHSLLSHPEKGRTRAFLKIQDGCGYGCSYCTIPKVRGPSRSVSADLLLDTAGKIAEAGYREIVLTGVNIADYRDGTTGFARLLQRLETVCVSRIRIGSVEPDLLDDELIEIVAGSEKIMPHFHLPLQSGSDAVLRAMGRHYDTKTYHARLMHVLQKIPCCGIGADVMAGYPGETEQDFQDMYTFLEGLPVAYLHVFSCSVRPGTLLARQVAAKTRRIVPSPVAAARARQLALLGEKKERQFASACIGQEMSVLFEEIRMSGDGKKIHAIGYSPNYLRVSACVERQGDPEFLKGMECRVRIEGIEEDLHLTGSLLF